jgi:hypothetical protein
MKFNSEVKNDTLFIRLEGDLIGENDGAGVLSKQRMPFSKKY